MLRKRYFQFLISPVFGPQKQGGENVYLEKIKVIISLLSQIRSFVGFVVVVVVCFTFFSYWKHKAPTLRS